MKKVFKSNLRFIVIAVLLFGCRGQKEDFLVPTASTSFETEVSSKTASLPSDSESPIFSESDKLIIKNYCDGLKTLAFESGAMTAKALNYDSYDEVPVEEILRNPLVVHLQFLDIEEEGTNDPIHFYDLALEDREEFFNAYLKEERKSLEEKALLVPELLTEIKKHNLACEKVFSSQDIEYLDCENMDFSKYSMAKPRSSNKLKRHSNSIKGVDLFDLIEGELDSMSKIQDNVALSDPLSSAMIRRSSSGGGWGYDSVKNWIILKHLEAGVRRGDILIRKKNWWTIGKKFSIAGHAGIINTPLNWDAQPRTKLSIDSTPKDEKEGYSDGVQYMNFDTWCRPHLVLGIRKTKTSRSRVRIRGRYRYYRSYVKIEDLSKMADRAILYLGRPYGNVFKTMKEVPNKFICSSLVWYCAKMEYGIDISNGSRKYVWPSDILKDSNTYIKTEYED